MEWGLGQQAGTVPPPADGHRDAAGLGAGTPRMGLCHPSQIDFLIHKAMSVSSQPSPKHGLTSPLLSLGPDILPASKESSRGPCSESCASNPQLGPALGPAHSLSHSPDACSCPVVLAEPSRLRAVQT